MTQDEFIAVRQPDWRELESLLGELQGRGVRRLEAYRISRVAALYRSLSADIARAEGSRFADDVLSYLERLAARAHAALYAAPPWRVRSVVGFLVNDFPVTLRRRIGFFAAAAALFFVPMIAGMVGAILSSDFAERIVPPSALMQAAESFGERFGGGRGHSQDAMMTGFYVFNNVGIAFRCFATGIFFGLGSVFFLVYNGLIIGTVLGYVIHLGYGDNILSFVASHSPFELTAIVIAGGAGLQMGFSLVRTRGESRLGSLRRQGPEILRIVMGAAVMLLIAALIEGNWSGSALPGSVKIIAGGALTLVVASYLALAGRAPGEESAANNRIFDDLREPTGAGGGA